MPVTEAALLEPGVVASNTVDLVYQQVFEYM